MPNTGWSVPGNGDADPTRTKPHPGYMSRARFLSVALQLIQMTPAGIRLQGRWFEESKIASAQDQEQGITEHGIVYFKQDGKIQVKEEPVDFTKAKSEIESLGYGHESDTFIGFINNKTHEMIQFAHYEADGWYADVPIPPTGTYWSGYVWGCKINTESVVSVSKLFIEESPWFDTLPFTMRQHRKNS